MEQAGDRECGRLFSPGWPGQGLTFSAVSSPEAPCPHTLLAPVPSSSWHLTCVPWHCGHHLRSWLAASFCQNSVALHPHQPGNRWPSGCLATSLTTTPDLVPHTAPGLKVTEAGTGDQPRAELQGPMSGHRHPYVGLVPTLSPSSPDPNPLTGQSIVLDTGLPPRSPNLTFCIPKPLRPHWGQLGTLPISGRRSLFQSANPIGSLN